MKMPKALHTAEEWHFWFTHQATWTQDMRRWLYGQAGLGQAHRALEVGCGTGVIAGEVAGLGPTTTGLDIDPAMLAVARRYAPGVHLLQGDAHALPFADGTFDIVLCHYLLLWVADPARAVQEMARVARPGGTVLACAEPDYGGRVDYPAELLPLGRLQAASLRRQGADPEIGRRLGELFCAAGLHTTVGVMAGQWTLPASSDAALAAEWAVLRQDLAGLATPEELDRWEAIDRQAWQSGRRMLFVPTFYAYGRKAG